MGRLIKRRPSQQQIRARSEDSDTKKCKLPRSRSERILGTKSKAFFENEDDGFSVHEINNSFGKLVFFMFSNIKGKHLKKYQK